MLATRKVRRSPGRVWFYQAKGYGGKEVWVASWYLPNGKRRTVRLSGVTSKDEAETEYRMRHSPAHERYEPALDSIEVARRSFKRQVLVALKPATQYVYRRMFGLLFLAGITSTHDIRADRMRDLIDVLLKTGIAASTQHKLLRAARSFFGWAKTSGYIDAVPTMQMPKVRRKSKGRPLTEAEFHLMLAATDTVYARRPERAESCKRLLWGLWEGGLRISEMVVSWDDRFAFHVDWTSHKRPVFVMPDQFDKTGQDRIFPMTPEFWELISQTPAEERHGPVFRVRPVWRNHECLTPAKASALIARIGEMAGVIVSKTPKGVKFASAHDLRRSFGLRWSQRVNQMQLMALMRHSDPSVTAIYYLGTNASTMLESVWAER